MFRLSISSFLPFLTSTFSDEEAGPSNQASFLRDHRMSHCQSAGLLSNTVVWESCNTVVWESCDCPANGIKLTPQISAICLLIFGAFLPLSLAELTFILSHLKSNSRVLIFTFLQWPSSWPSSNLTHVLMFQLKPHQVSQIGFSFAFF